MECDYCNYRSLDPQRIVYEDEDFVAFTEGAEGICILIPKEHAKTMEEIANADRFRSLIGYLSQSMKDALVAKEIKTEIVSGEHINVRLVPVGGTAPKDFQEKIMWNLRNSKWYDTLNS